MQSVAPSSEPPNPSGVRRTLLIIGGAEDRIGRSVVLKRFIKLAGGRRSHIVVIPTASSYAGEVSEAYRDVFTRLRGGDVSVVHPETRRDANDPTMVEALDTRPASSSPAAARSSWPRTSSAPPWGRRHPRLRARRRRRRHLGRRLDHEPLHDLAR